MYLDPKSTILDIQATRIRDVLRSSPYCFQTEYLSYRLRLSTEEGQRLIDELMRRGLLEVEPHLRGRKYCLTLNGGTFSQASAARPISRATAERKLDEFMARVHAVNADEHYLYVVRRVVLFGSFLTDAPKLNDVDVAIDLARRFDGEVQIAKEREHRAQAQAGGRRFATYFEELAWSEYEVELFLKSRSRAIRLHRISNEERMLATAKTRQLFPVEKTSRKHGQQPVESSRSDQRPHR
jgi:predicted transcriptional regulator/predicted nucleotidyltransferase